MKQYLGKFLSVLVFLCSLFVFSSFAQAATHNLPANQTLIGQVSKVNPKEQYVIELPASGKLTLNIGSYTNIQVRAYDGGGTNLFKEANVSGSTSSEAKQNLSVYAEKGKYYIDVLSTTGDEGKFNLKYTFNSYSNNEIESNNTIESAQTIQPNTNINGLFSYRDHEDVYRIEVQQPGKLTLKADSYVNTDIEFVDANGVKLMERDSLKANDATKVSRSYVHLLNPGVYYVKMHGITDHTGRYTLKYQLQGFDYTEDPNNSTRESAQVLQNKKTLFGSITPTDSTVDWYQLEVDKPTLWKIAYSGDMMTNVKVYGEEITELAGTPENGARKYEQTHYLSPGKYFIKVDRATPAYGLYTLRTEWSTVKSDEQAFDNTLEKAAYLPFSQKKYGVFSLTDKSDVYRIDVKQSGYVAFTLSANTEARFKVTDAKEIQVLDTKEVYGTEQTARSVTRVKYLKKGSYYIFTSPGYNYTGRYNVQAQFSTTKATVSSVTTPKAKATKISGKATKSSTVYVKVGTKTYKAKATTKGTFTVKVPKLKKGATIQVYASNTFGKSAVKKVKVK